MHGIERPNIKIWKNLQFDRVQRVDWIVRIKKKYFFFSLLTSLLYSLRYSKRFTYEFYFLDAALHMCFCYFIQRQNLRWFWSALFVSEYMWKLKKRQQFLLRKQPIFTNINSLLFFFASNLQHTTCVDVELTNLQKNRMSKRWTKEIYITQQTTNYYFNFLLRKWNCNFYSMYAILICLACTIWIERFRCE